MYKVVNEAFPLMECVMNQDTGVTTVCVMMKVTAECRNLMFLWLSQCGPPAMWATVPLPPHVTGSGVFK